MAITVNGTELTDQDIERAYLTDWRKRYRGETCAVLLPGDTEQVARVVRLARQALMQYCPNVALAKPGRMA
ncbi:hypothetical protein [Caballeronia sp. M23-90]